VAVTIGRHDLSARSVGSTVVHVSSTGRADRSTRPWVAAGVLFFDERDRVLLVVPSYKPYRDIPGGYVEQGETPYQGATREVEEELGITPPIGRLLVVDWAPSETEGDKVLFLFDGGVLTEDDRGKITLDPGEISGYAFHAVDEIAGLTIPRLVRRVRHGCGARRDGGTRYLEYGEIVSTVPPRDTMGEPGRGDPG
jgi:8-oxo-dGTP diphosphatase